MPISTRVTATVGAVLLLFSAQASSAQESSQQSPTTTDIPERYRRQVAPTPSTYWQSPALHDYTRVLKSSDAPVIGSPRISYGGYQTGLGFYKATLQNLGAAVSATVVRDRLIGVAFGLIVFGVVEHVLWPVRAADRMHARLADVLRSLGAFARVASRPLDDRRDVDARRQLIAQQVTDVQGFIESSKFEPGAGAADAQEVERLTADAQAVFIVLLAIARDAATLTGNPAAVRAAAIRVDDEVALVLEALADRVGQGGGAAASTISGSLASFEPSISALVAAAGADVTCAGAVALYRELAVAMNRLTASSVRSIPTAAHPVVAG